MIKKRNWELMVVATSFAFLGMTSAGLAQEANPSEGQPQYHHHGHHHHHHHHQMGDPQNGSVEGFNNNSGGPKDFTGE